MVGARVLAQGMIDGRLLARRNRNREFSGPARVTTWARRGAHPFAHNVAFSIVRHLASHDVVHASMIGSNELSNGFLIAAAEADGFEVVISCDQNLEYRQNLSVAPIDRDHPQHQQLGGLTGRAIAWCRVGGICKQRSICAFRLLSYGAGRLIINQAADRTIAANRSHKIKHQRRLLGRPIT